MSNFPAPAPSWSDVARVCRRVCILRERGQHDDAELMRAGPLHDVLAAVRKPSDTDSSVAERLEATFAIEAERVTNAAVLAELLVPMIAEQLRTSPISSSQLPLPASPVVVEAPRPHKPPTSSRNGSIADFIDEMIAQENPPDRPGGTTQRRAS